MGKIIKYIKKPKYILLLLEKLNLIKLNDELYLKCMYEQIFNQKLNLNNPTTFNEKLQWLKINDRKDIYTTMVDKYEVKNYVANIIGKKHIIPTIGVYDKFDDINFEELPEQFIIKCTHDSGSTIICKNKKEFNIQETKKKISKALKHNYYYYGREWPYKNVKPRILIEKYMEEMGKEELTDYKLMCFNGKVRCSFVCLNRYSSKGLNVDFYDINWNKMSFERHYKNSNVILEKPKNYKMMIELAEKLSHNIPFVRVDFYEINNKLYFGELTFYPGSGFEEFKPEKYDEILGNMIKLPLTKKEEK